MMKDLCCQVNQSNGSLCFV